MPGLGDVISRCMAQTAAHREAEAARRGVTVDELTELIEAGERAERRRQAIEASGASLPVRDVESLATCVGLDVTEPLDLVQRWWRARVERPIFVICGHVGVGKTVAATWAIAEHCGGAVVHSPELVRRILPTRHDREIGVRQVHLETSLLVLDDLGTEASAQLHRWPEAFAILIERRLRHGRTIITSNLERRQFRARYGERIISRLNASAHVAELKSKASLRAAGGGL